MATDRLESYRVRSASQSLIKLFASWKYSQWQGEGRVAKMAFSSADKPSTVLIMNPLVLDNGYCRTKIFLPFPVRVVGNAPRVAMGDWVSFGHLMHSGSGWNSRKLPGLETMAVGIKNRGVRRGIREAVQARMKGDALGLFEGLLWGDTSMLSRLRLEQFRGTGLIHLLAVSGMNIGGVLLLSSLFVGVLARIPGVLGVVSSQTLFLALYAMIGIAYLLLADFPVGLTRAYMMGGMALLGFMSASESRAMQMLSVAFFVIVLGNPSVVSEVSFQLSFLSTCAVIVSAGLWRAIQRRARGVPTGGAKRYLLALAFTSLFVTLTLAPYLIYLFGEAPLGSSVLNLVFIPLTELVLFPLAAVACLSSFVFPPMAALLAWCFNVTAACSLSLMGCLYSLAWVQKSSLILNLSPVHLNLFYGAWLVGSFWLLKKARAWQG